uniref:Chromosome 8 open reading frame 76 n=1 Tax=Sciurus vulgaris TaxID=55149 RepID=A0A8D2CLY4_SCIVU
MEPGFWIGGEFEDSVFEEGPRRRPGPPAPYRAKRCEPQWFYEETESSDDVEVLTIKKFKGDLAYRRQEYEKALQEYSSISEKLSSTNFAMKKDVQEGQARCLAHLGRHVEALEIATNLENKATNTDHLTTVLYLQLAICSSLQNLEKTIFCLQKLISLHPFNPWSWGKLAEAYLNLGPALSASFASSQRQNSFTSTDETIQSSFSHSGKDYPLCFPETVPESSVFSVEASGSNGQKTEKAFKNSQNCVTGRGEAVLMETQMKACASLIRTRLLLQLTQSQQTSFALERNLRTQQEIEDKMKGFSFKEDTLLWIAEVMGEDIIPEKIKDEVHAEVKSIGSAALTALVTASSKEFEDKWFRKIKDHFCPFENQFHTEIQILA